MSRKFSIFPKFLSLKKNKIFITVLVLYTSLSLYHLSTEHLDFEPQRIQTQKPDPVQLDRSKKYVSIRFLTVVAGGGLGNQLFEAFSLIGMAKKLNRTAIYSSEDQKLSEKFKFLHKTLPDIRDYLMPLPIDKSRSSEYSFPGACCKYSYNCSLEKLETKFLVLHGAYYQSFKYFENIQDTIRELLGPADDEDYLTGDIKLVKEEYKDKFKTCVHVRRGDFLTDGQHEGTNATFTMKAIEYLNEKKRNGVFYIFSNDPRWVYINITSNLQNGIEVEILNSQPELAIEDLYFSQIWCDSFLITAPSSTFGWWLSYLSKNQKEVYYRDIFETNDQVKNQMNDSDFFPKEWKKMGMFSNGTVALKNR